MRSAVFYRNLYGNTTYTLYTVYSNTLYGVQCIIATKQCFKPNPINKQQKKNLASFQTRYFLFKQNPFGSRPSNYNDETINKYLLVFLIGNCFFIVFPHRKTTAIRCTAGVEKAKFLIFCDINWRYPPVTRRTFTALWYWAV